MAITGISLVENQPFYSSFDDAPENEKTEWQIGSIDASIRGMIGDNAITWLQTENGTQMVNKQSQRNFEVCRFGLKGWDRFPNGKGGDVEYKQVPRIVNGRAYMVVDDEVLNLIPTPVVAEIAEKIMALNTATDTLRKK